MIFFVLMTLGDVVAYEEMKVREERGVSEKVSAKHWVWRIRMRDHMNSRNCRIMGSPVNISEEISEYIYIKLSFRPSP